MFGFGRKKAAQVAQEPPTVPMSMLQVFLLAYGAALARGWPEGAVASEIAWRALWLEERRLPGLGVLVNDFVRHRQEDIKARGQRCPIIRGAFFDNQAETLVSKTPERPHVIEGPDAAILLLPKVAQHAAQIGQVIRVSWVAGDRIQAQSFVAPDGQLGHGGALADVLSATATGFALHGGPYPFDRAEPARQTQIPEPVLDGIMGFIGPERMGCVSKVTALMQNDPVTVGLLHGQTAGERSNFVLLANAKAQGLEALPTFLVAKDSTNDRICGAMASYGWFQEDSAAVPAGTAAQLRAHRPTEAACQAMPMILAALDRFPPVRH
jgi:hypothetical protein